MGAATMSASNFGISLAGLLLTFCASIAVAELVGYAIHRILHGDRFPVLSRAHLTHHFLLYGPKQPMRAHEYKDATHGRFSLGNIGAEWIFPSALALAICWGVMQLFRVSRPYEFLALATLLAWPLFMFSYMHDRMHLQGFWMERAPILKNWFLKARRLHDIHHRSLNDEGRMDRNFGIAFFFFDRLFRTLAKHHCPFNWHGYRTAMRRYQLEVNTREDFSHFPSEFRV
jgi:Fatty acid hydroxylase superfamily